MANKKKKIRIELKKNRQKRTRANDLTRAFGDEKPAASESVAGERVRPKGEMSRRRTIVTDADEATPQGAADAAAGGASGRRAVDESAWLEGRVLRVHGLLNIVETADGRTYPCHVRRLLKSMAIDGRNVVAVGDRVWFRPPEGGAKKASSSASNLAAGSSLAPIAGAGTSWRPTSTPSSSCPPSRSPA